MLDERIASPVADHGAAIGRDDLARYASAEMLRHIVLDIRQMKSFLAEPLVMARAEGIWYWDIGGKRYLRDAANGVTFAPRTERGAVNP